MTLKKILNPNIEILNNIKIQNHKFIRFGFAGNIFKIVFPQNLPLIRDAVTYLSVAVEKRRETLQYRFQYH